MAAAPILLQFEIAAPLLAWGALAAVVPIVIHLVLRQRARRQIFPAMQFLLPKLASATRAQRLRHLLLLACRMALIVTLAAMLMRISYRPHGQEAAAKWLKPAAAPVAAVLAIDDSASMGYRFQGTSRLQAAVSWARNLLADNERFPQGSQIAVISGSSRPEEIAWTQTPRAAERLLHRIQVSDHNRGAGLLLQQAYQLLATARHSRREVYLFNDLTEHSWAGALPQAPKELTGLYVCDVGQQENASAALLWPQIPEHELAVGRAGQIKLRVRTGDLPTEPLIETRIDEQVRSRRGLGPVPARDQIEADIELPALSAGAHRVEFSLEPADALVCDNRRFMLVSIGHLPQVSIVVGEPDRQVSALLSAMIAPPALSPSERAFDARELRAKDLAGSSLKSDVAVVLADAPPLSAEGWTVISRYLNAGGCLLLFPGPNFTSATFAENSDLLPARPASIGECNPPINLAAGNLDDPYLRPFRDTAIDSINSRAVYRRTHVAQVRPDARIIAAFSDGQPAILERQVGKGKCILFAFSPAAEWSQFGTQAAPLIVLLHTILGERVPRPEGVLHLTAGQTVSQAFSDPSGIQVRGPHDEPPRELSRTAGQVKLPTAEAGFYELVSAGRPAVRYAVNIAEAESDPSRRSREAVLSALPPGVSMVASNPAQLLRPEAVALGPAALLGPLGLILLVLLISESLFANRFYGILKPKRPTD